MNVLTADLSNASDVYLRELMEQIASTLASRETNEFTASTQNEFAALDEVQMSKAREFARLNGHEVSQDGVLSIGLQMKYSSLHDSSTVRQWAQMNGIEVSERGRIAKTVWDTWFEFNSVIPLPSKVTKTSTTKRKKSRTLTSAARDYGKSIGLIPEGSHNGQVSKKVWEAFTASMV